MLRPDDAVAIATLRSPATMRARAESLFALATGAGGLEHFTVEVGKIGDLAAALGPVALSRLELDAVTPAARLAPSIAGLSSDDQSRAGVDAVLIDAVLGGLRGDSPSEDGIARYARGDFGTADAAALQAVPETRALGAAIAAAPQWFPGARPSGLIEALVGKPEVAAPADHDATWPHRLVPSIEATAILRLLLEGLEPLWAGANAIGGVRLGDVWKHPKVAGNGASKGYMPIHALAVRTAFALFDPLERAGYTIVQPNALVPVADERTTGLLIDAGVLVPKYREVTEMIHDAGDDCAVEGRALALAIYERVATGVRQATGKTATELPMHKVMEAVAIVGRERAGKRPQALPAMRLR